MIFAITEEQLLLNKTIDTLQWLFLLGLHFSSAKKKEKSILGFVRWTNSFCPLINLFCKIKCNFKLVTFVCKNYINLYHEPNKAKGKHYTFRTLQTQLLVIERTFSSLQVSNGLKMNCVFSQFWLTFAVCVNA